MIKKSYKIEITKEYYTVSFDSELNKAVLVYDTAVATNGHPLHSLLESLFEFKVKDIDHIISILKELKKEYKEASNEL